MSRNIETVLQILKNEVDGDVSSALQKMASDYSMTWMYRGASELFPQIQNNIEGAMQDIAYPIKGRKYEIKHIAEGEEVIMVELIESYPDPETTKRYTTPLVLVLEMKEGKISRGRHYCDPRLSHEELTSDSLKKAYKNSVNKLVIE